MRRRRRGEREEKEEEPLSSSWNNKGFGVVKDSAAIADGYFDCCALDHR